MLARTITTELGSTRICRLLALCVAGATVFASTFAEVGRADDDPLPTGSIPIAIHYFDCMPSGEGVWMASGFIQSQSLSTVTVQFSGALLATTAPNEYGYFCVFFYAAPGAFVEVCAMDSTGESHDATTLVDFSL